MDAAELRNLNKDELLKKVETLRHDLRLIRFKQSKGEVKNILEKKHVKKDIARILTILKEKQ